MYKQISSSGRSKVNESLSSANNFCNRPVSVYDNCPEGREQEEIKMELGPENEKEGVPNHDENSNISSSSESTTDEDERKNNVKRRAELFVTLAVQKLKDRPYKKIKFGVKVAQIITGAIAAGLGGGTAAGIITGVSMVMPEVDLTKCLRSGNHDVQDEVVMTALVIFKSLENQFMRINEQEIKNLAKDFIYLMDKDFITKKANNLSDHLTKTGLAIKQKDGTFCYYRKSKEHDTSTYGYRLPISGIDDPEVLKVLEKYEECKNTNESCNSEVLKQYEKCENVDESYDYVLEKSNLKDLHKSMLDIISYRNTSKALKGIKRKHMEEKIDNITKKICCKKEMTMIVEGALERKCGKLLTSLKNDYGKMSVGQVHNAEMHQLPYGYNTSHSDITQLPHGNLIQMGNPILTSQGNQCLDLMSQLENRRLQAENQSLMFQLKNQSLQAENRLFEMKGGAPKWPSEETQQLKHSLFKAVETGSINEVMGIINDNTALITERDGNHASLLHYAARKKDSKVLKFLIDRLSRKNLKDLINCKDKQSRTPLYYAAASKASYDVVKMLIDSGADPHACDECSNGIEPILHVANQSYSKDKDRKVIKLLSSNVHDSSAKDPVYMLKEHHQDYRKVNNDLCSQPMLTKDSGSELKGSGTISELGEYIKGQVSINSKNVNNKTPAQHGNCDLTPTSRVHQVSLIIPTRVFQQRNEERTIRSPGSNY